MWIISVHPSVRWGGIPAVVCSWPGERPVPGLGPRVGFAARDAACAGAGRLASRWTPRQPLAAGFLALRSVPFCCSGWVTRCDLRRFNAGKSSFLPLKLCSPLRGTGGAAVQEPRCRSRGAGTAAGTSPGRAQVDSAARGSLERPLQGTAVSHVLLPTAAPAPCGSLRC